MVDLGLISVVLWFNGNTGQYLPRAAWSKNSGHSIEAWENEKLTGEREGSGRMEHMGETETRRVSHAECNGELHWDDRIAQ